MIISDLNYLEVNEDEVFGGLFIVPNVNRKEIIKIDVEEKIKIDKNVKSNVNIKGSLATAQANVVDFKNALAETSTYNAPGLTSSTSVSAGSNY